MKIFISHSEEDKTLVRNFVEMLFGIGLKEKDIFCSSIAELGVPNNEDIYDYLKSIFQNEPLYVLFMLSENYYNSKACLNEMGAAWITQSAYTTFLLPCFTFKQIEGAINPRKIAIKLDSTHDILKPRLNSFKDELVKLFHCDLSESRWEKVRDLFLQTIVYSNKINLYNTQTFCIGDNSANGCTLVKRHEHEIEALIDFTKTNSDLCSVVVFPDFKNWEQFVTENKSMTFSASCTNIIKNITLEVKFNDYNIKYSLNVDSTLKQITVPLLNICNNINDWRNVREICFLFNKDCVNGLSCFKLNNMTIE